MSLQLNPHTDEILYNGKVVGKHSLKDGKQTVTLSIEYEAEDDWIAPLAWFAFGLSELEANQSKPADLEIHLNVEEVDDVEGANIYLIEKTIKSGGYVWKFHKSDADTWPSLLHGHDYDKHLKLDAITGKIYDVTTEQHCKTVKAKRLKSIQDQLCNSRDFNTKAKKFLPNCEG